MDTHGFHILAVVNDATVNMDMYKMFLKVKSYFPVLVYVASLYFRSLPWVEYAPSLRLLQEL